MVKLMSKSKLFMIIAIISEVIGFTCFFLLDLSNPNALYMIYAIIIFLGIGIISQILMMIYKYYIESKFVLRAALDNWDRDATIQVIIITFVVGFLWLLLFRYGEGDTFNWGMVIFATLFILILAPFIMLDQLYSRENKDKG
jgi:uncharacterized membrane-anchored protein